MSALEVARDRAVERVRALPLRMHTPKSVAAQALMLQVGLELTRQLLELRAGGVAVSDEIVALAFDALDDGTGRLVELMPNERRGR